MTFHFSPKSWRKVSLSDCCKIISGATPRRDNPEYWCGTIPWVTPKDLSNLDVAIIEDAPEYITEKGYRSCSTDLLPKGAVLFSSRAPIGHVAIAGRPMCTNQGFKSLIPGDELTSSYLYWCLRKMVPEISARGTGTTFKEVSKAVMEEFVIPLPSLPEQKRIAAILDKADSIRRKRQEAVRLTEELLRSVFLDMFGDPVTNPKGWKVKSFENLLEIPLRNGLSPATGGQYSGKVLTLSAITGSYFCASAIKPAVFSKDLPTDKFVNPRDFLICRGNGNANLVGKGSFPLDEIDNTLFPDTMIAARINPDKVVPEFLEMIWHTQLVRSQIDKGARTTNGTFKVNQGVLNAVKILCPPIEIQTKFSVIVKSAVGSQIKNSTSLEYSNILFNSLLHRAFKGEL
jgi:type I restriction enzyme S subunit